MPEFDLRRAHTAQDPYAVIEGYKIEIYKRLATLVGVRMCPQCPRCNETGHGCQDRFGSNMRPGGGSLGAIPAFGGGTENEGYGVPDLHVEAHMGSIYPYGTLEDVVKAFREGQFRCSDGISYNEWLLYFHTIARQHFMSKKLEQV